MVLVAHPFQFEPTCLGVLFSFLLPLNAHTVIDQWEGRCYEAVDIAEQSIEDLGAFTAYEGGYGVARVLRGIWLQHRDSLHGWSDAGSSSFQVNRKPGIFQSDRDARYSSFNIHQLR